MVSGSLPPEDVRGHIGPCRRIQVCVIVKGLI